MSVIDFIERDIARSPQRPSKAWLLGALVALICIGSAFGLREDFDGVFTWEYLLPSAAMLALLMVALRVGAAQGLRPRTRLAIICLSGALVLALSCIRPGFPSGTSYASTAIFWQEAGRCFVKGLGTSLVCGALLSAIVFRLLPLPGRLWQTGLAIVSGLAGIAMLNLHCAFADVRHIVVGHWAPALLVMLPTIAWQRLLFRHYSRAALGDHGSRLKRLDRIDRT